MEHPRQLNLEPYRHVLEQVDPVLHKGWVTQVIGAVIEADIWRLAQAPAGSCLRFVLVTYQDALAAKVANETQSAMVGRLRSTSNLQST